VIYDPVISHPSDSGTGVKLTDHLRETAERISTFETFGGGGASSGRSGKQSDRSGKQDDSAGTLSERDVAVVIARLHDFGKVTPQFQQYVRKDLQYHGEEKYTYHARIGALATYWVLSELGADEREALAGFGAVVKHHGRLPNFATYTENRVCGSERAETDPRQWVGEQIDEIDEETAETADEILSTASDGAVSWEAFADAFRDGTLLDSLSEAVTDGNSLVRKPDAERLPEELYDRLLRYWSGLTLADKTCAAAINGEKLAADHLDLDSLDDHVEGLSGDTPRQAELNESREDARQEVRDNAVERLLDGDASVGTLTLPTGLGKTFTGITAAYTLRDEIGRRRGRDQPRVVYALPYTSIIEQTRETFENSKIWGADPTGRAFTVHHYLSETVTDVDTEDPERDDGDAGSGDAEAEDDYGPSAAEMLGESWRSGTVLTTFVQLFESLTGPSNSQGLKLSALQDAVVILDEPQALPKNWWAVVPRLVELLVDEYDVTVVSMTATQPRLFRASERLDTVPLLDENDVEEYYRDVERVTYTIDSSVQSLASENTETRLRDHQTASDRIVSDLLDGRSLGKTGPSADEAEPSADEAEPSADEAGPSALAVCNTIASARTLAEEVENTATSRDRAVTRLGSVYDDVLEELEQPGENGATQASHEELLRGTLSKLGFEPVSDESDDTVSEDSTDSESFEWVGGTSPSLVLGELSSRYRPKDRAVFVAVAEVLSTSPVPFVFVSTQAIEAGVDLSFQRAYRDLAPLDSVVQAAGRCNRSFEWGERNGEVTIWCLSDPEDADEPIKKAPVSHVYDSVPDHVDLLAGLLSEELSGTTAVPEIELTRSVVPKYFAKIPNEEIGSQSILDNIETCEAGKLASASLIGGYETVDVLVAQTHAERDLLSEIREAFDVGNTPKAFEKLQAASDLRVSVAIQDADEALTSLTRVDNRSRGDPEGVTVLAFEPNAGDGRYDLDDGGFYAESGGISGRFT
jgi:CRISPR-associated endonuclease Cas3-HD